MLLPFDRAWYLSQLPCVVPEPEDHFHQRGAEQNLSPSPYLDPIYYYRHNPDVAALGSPAFVHFCAYGHAERRSPHPLFDTSWYVKTYMDQGEEDEKLSPFEHYLRIGWRKGHQPNPAFWTSWYIKKYRIATEPLLHYILNGSNADFLPNPVFISAFFLNAVRGEGIDLSEYKNNPLIAYMSVEVTRNCSFNPLFDLEYFHAQYLQYGSKRVSANPLVDFLNSAPDVDPHILFSRKYYRENKGCPLQHENELADYFDMPDTKRPDPSPFFSRAYYYRNRPDVLSHKQDALIHYLTCGHSEGSNPHPLLDMVTYSKANSDCKPNPLSHYLAHGFARGVAVRSSIAPVRSARRATDQSVLAVANSKAAIESPSTAAKKGLFIHIFYPELSGEVFEHTNVVPPPCKLYISTTDTQKAREIETAANKLSIHPFEIRVFSNRGRDIAPFIVGFADRIREIDLGCHLHTKRSAHYRNGLDSWRRYLFRQTLGTRESVQNVLSIFDDPEIGAIAPADYYAVRRLIQWGGNLPNINALVSLMSNFSLHVDEKSILEFPSGSMFWFRSAALRPLLEVGLRFEHFDPERGQIDGTLAHAIERSFFFVIELAGYKWLRFELDDTALARDRKSIERYAKAILLPVKSRAEPLLRSAAELRPFTLTPDYTKRARLNLLVPTIDTSVAYAGVSEALRLYYGILGKLRDRVDGRIIVTDGPLAHEFAPPADEVVAQLSEVTPEHIDSVVDGTMRSRECLAVRAQDVFIASAWWTARIIRDLMGQQVQRFGLAPAKFLYVIQDYECGFYPWSTKYVLAEQTYLNADQIIPIFNTELLACFFRDRGYFDDGIIYNPPMNEHVQANLRSDKQREKIVLIYMRPHATRNCLEFAEEVVECAVVSAPEFWSDWSFYAVGEDFTHHKHLSSPHISVLGRLSLERYAELLSVASAGLSLMVSPHPSYPPLEMAAAGVLTLANTYEGKDLSLLHDNIHSFAEFDAAAVAARLRRLAEENYNRQTGSNGSAKIDWFFDGRSNLDEAIERASAELQLILKGCSG